MPSLKPDSRIFIAGGNTLAGRSLASYLTKCGFNPETDISSNADLQNSASMQTFFQQFEPEYIFFAGARSAGIEANRKYPKELLAENSLAAVHVFENAARFRVKKILYLASSCIYPVNAPQPMKPESLFTGPLEPISESYALSKILGLKLAQASRVEHGLNAVTAIPADIFGPEDDFDPDHSHVVAALIRKLHTAKEKREPAVTLWGTGNPVRDFLFSDDLAAACLFLMENYDGTDTVNISAGNPLPVKQLALKIAGIVKFQGRILWDTARPDGAPVKTLDASFLKSMGWRSATPPDAALLKTYEGFLAEKTKQLA